MCVCVCVCYHGVQAVVRSQLDTNTQTRTASAEKFNGKEKVESQPTKSCAVSPERKGKDKRKERTSTPHRKKMIAVTESCPSSQPVCISDGPFVTLCGDENRDPLYIFFPKGLIFLSCTFVTWNALKWLTSWGPCLFPVLCEFTQSN